MSTREIRDPGRARRFVAQGLWFQRVLEPRARRVEEILAWSMEAASGGDPIVPIGLVADLGHLIYEPERPGFAGRSGVAVPGWPAGRVRAYDDLVLGKLDTDPTIGRASDALARTRGRDRARGLAFVLGRLLERSGSGGILINPVALKVVPGRPASDLLVEGWESLERDGPMPELLELYERLVEAARDMGDALGPEDVFELEHGTALAAFGQRVALRQVIQTASEFEAATAGDRPRPTGRSLGVSTKFLHEDAYPVGGFSSISTRGSIESLLHSQLVFMEREERPDLFDIKYVRDELLYYSRDENQFLRRRRTFIFALAPDLELARVKDGGLPRQRLVLLLGALIAAVRRLAGWLGDEALTFEFLFLEAGAAGPLDRERELIELVLGDSVARGEVVVAKLPASRLAEHREAAGRRSLCHVLVASTDAGTPEPGPPPDARWILDAPIPGLCLDGEELARPGPVAAIDAWREQLTALLERWI